MNDQIKLLFRRIRRWHNRSTCTGTKPLPAPHLLPPPQITWVLLTLVNYACRRLWAWRELVPKIVLSADSYLEQGLGAAVNFRPMKSGDVPDSRHWRYNVSCRDLCLTNRATNEWIEINIHNGPELVATNHFCTFATTQRVPQAAVQRLGELLPTGGLPVAFNRLREYGVFHALDKDGRGDVLLLYLHDSLLKYPDAVHAFLTAWDRPENRIVLASLIGDWPALQTAATALGQADLAARAGVLAEQARRRWLTVLRMDAENGLQESTLLALADAGAEDLSDYLTPALANPSLAPTAVQIANRGVVPHGQQNGEEV